MHIIHTSSYIYIFTCTHIHIYIYICIRIQYTKVYVHPHDFGQTSRRLSKGQPSLGRAFGLLVAVAHSTSIITTIHAANWGFGYCWKFKAQS